MKNKLVILYDGHCSFCSYWVKFVLKRDKHDLFRFTSLQSEKGIELLEKYEVPKELDSVVLISDDSAYIKSNAVFLILQKLGGWRMVFIGLKIFPRFIRDFVYDLIARSRYKLFKKKVCSLPLNVNYKEKFIS